MIASIVRDLSLTDALLLIGLVGIGVTKGLEASGRLRSSKLLREDNLDLTHRVATLLDRIAELEQQKAEGMANELKLLARIEALELKVRDLEGRDQGAVLHALAEHEVRAQARADNGELAAAGRHTEAMGAWSRIADALEKGA